MSPSGKQRLRVNAVVKVNGCYRPLVLWPSVDDIYSCEVNKEVVTKLNLEAVAQGFQRSRLGSASDLVHTTNVWYATPDDGAVLGTLVGDEGGQGDSAMLPTLLNCLCQLRGIEESDWCPGGPDGVIFATGRVEFDDSGPRITRVGDVADKLRAVPAELTTRVHFVVPRGNVDDLEKLASQRSWEQGLWEVVDVTCLESTSNSERQRVIVLVETYGDLVELAEYLGLLRPFSLPLRRWKDWKEASHGLPPLLGGRQLAEFETWLSRDGDAGANGDEKELLKESLQAQARRRGRRVAAAGILVLSIGLAVAIVQAIKDRERAENATRNESVAKKIAEEERRRHLLDNLRSAALVIERDPRLAAAAILEGMAVPEYADEAEVLARKWLDRSLERVLRSSGDVARVRWTPDGRLLIVGSRDGAIQVWDHHGESRLLRTERESRTVGVASGTVPIAGQPLLHSGAPVGALTCFQEYRRFGAVMSMLCGALPVGGLTWIRGAAPDWGKFAVSGGSGTVFFDAYVERELTNLRCENTRMGLYMVNPDQAVPPMTLAGRIDPSLTNSIPLRGWISINRGDGTKEIVPPETDDHAREIAASGDGARVVAVFDSGFADVGASGVSSRRFAADVQKVIGATLSGDGTRVAVEYGVQPGSEADHTWRTWTRVVVGVWDVRVGREITRLSVSDVPVAMGWRNGRLLVVQKDGCIRSWSEGDSASAGGRFSADNVFQKCVNGEPAAATFGVSAAVGVSVVDATGAVTTWDESGRLDGARVYVAGGGVTDLAWDDAGDHLAVATGREARIYRRRAGGTMWPDVRTRCGAYVPRKMGSGFATAWTRHSPFRLAVACLNRSELWILGRDAAPLRLVTSGPDNDPDGAAKEIFWSEDERRLGAVVGTEGNVWWLKEDDSRDASSAGHSLGEPSRYTDLREMRRAMAIAPEPSTAANSTFGADETSILKGAVIDQDSSCLNAWDGLRESFVASPDGGRVAFVLGGCVGVGSLKGGKPRIWHLAHPRDASARIDGTVIDVLWRPDAAGIVALVDGYDAGHDALWVVEYEELSRDELVARLRAEAP